MSATSLNRLRAELKAAADPERAKASAWFFKTGPGQYGEGDVFYGITVPTQRKIAKKYMNIVLADVEKLLQSKVHEERLTACIILVDQYKKADPKTKQAIYEFYLDHTSYINNWDIVDSSAPYIVGEYLWRNYAQDTTKSQKALGVLTSLANSKSIWERRIAMLATFYFIDRGDIAEAFAVADMLLMDEHDLIQKAVGWMLREIGKRVSQEQEERFLMQHGRYKQMPRTMLRYAIERFPEDKRQAYLHGLV